MSRRDAIASLAAATMKERFDRLTDLSRSLASRVQFRQLLQEGRWEEASRILSSIPREFPFIDRIVLTDPHGTLMADLPPRPEVWGKHFAFRDWYQGVLRTGRPYVSAVYVRAARPQHPVVGVAAPVFQDLTGRLLGILLLQIRTDTFLEWAKQIEVGPEGFVFFTDHRGHLAAHPRILPQGAVMDFSEAPGVQRAIAGERGVDIVFTPVEQEERVIAYAAVPTYGWGVVAVQPARSAFAAREATLRGVAWVSKFLVGLAGVLAAVLLGLLRMLHASHERQNAFLHSIGHGVIGTDAEGRITMANRMAELMFGWTAHEAVGRSAFELLHLENRSGNAIARELRPLARVLSTGRQDGGLVYGMRRDGTRFPAEILVTPIRLNGTLAGTIAVIRDVTLRVQMEQALQESEARLRAVLQTAHDAIISMDTQGAIVMWNLGAQRTFGYTTDEALGRPMTEMVPERLRPTLQRRLRRYLVAASASGMSRTLQLVAVRKTGEEFPAELTLSSWARGDEVFFTAIIRDITERNALEAQLAQAQKFELIGQLAAGIAHEINTPIQYISSNAAFLQSSFENLERLVAAYGRLIEQAGHGPVASPQLAELQRLAEQLEVAYLRAESPRALQELRDGVQRIAEIVRSINRLAHPGQDQKQPTDLNQAIQHAVTMAHSEWRYVAELVTELDPSLPPVPCIEGEIEQAILNILLNAAQAIGDIVDEGRDGKGRITVSTRRFGQWAELRIQDTGPGIPEAIRQKIFTPFFTTKDVGKGTGQGLAIAHAIVVGKHGGSLTFETAEGRGTTFIIRLPLTEHALAPDAIALTPHHP